MYIDFIYWYTILFNGPLQWYNWGLKPTILFTDTILFNHTILFAGFYGTAEFTDEKNTYFSTWSGKLQWPAIVLTPEEYKLRVGKMSVTELRQLGNYWGQGGILGAVIDEERDLYRIVQDGSRLNPGVLSHWGNRECTQWLSHFIAKNHTLSAFYA